MIEDIGYRMQETGFRMQDTGCYRTRNPRTRKLYSLTTPISQNLSIRWEILSSGVSF